MNYKSNTLKIPGFIVCLLFALLFVSVLSTAALPYGAGTYGSCTYGSCTITLSTSGTVSLNLHPNGSGVYTIQKDEVNVKSGASVGYNLSLSSSSANTNLVNGSDTISTNSGTYTSPTSLSLNSWGYRLDGINNFGAGPTSSVTNVSSSSLSFAGIPASGTPDSIVTTTVASAPTVGDNYGIWYGVRADLTPPAGTYSQTLTYTATQNP